MLEKDFQTQFSEYNSKKKLAGAFELKDSLGKMSISYNSFEEQQIPSLQAIQNDGFRWKLSDADRRLKPCDYISTEPMRGFIALKFPKNICYIIDLDEFIRFRDQSSRKSITKEEAERICEREIQL